jgi:hypothetical protein
LSPFRAMRCADAVCLSNLYFLITSSCSLEELYFVVRALWREYNIADRELLDLIEKL